MKTLRLAALVAATGAAALAAAPSIPASASPAHPHGLPGGFKHLVVIYEENHSFDNLYGGWGRVGRDAVNGLAYVPQVSQNGQAYDCLLQNDVNLTSPPLPNTCSNPAQGVPASAFKAAPFTIDNYIKPTDTTCPPEGAFFPNGVKKGSGEPGGCTRDLVHRFYQEQYQIDGGKQDRYVTGSDAVGLTEGVYDTKQLPIYQYLHGKGAPNYVVADNFFQAAFGGSFLNHQFLVAARAPLDTDPAGGGALNSVVDSNGMPTSYPLYQATRSDVLDKQLTVKCTDGKSHPEHACGDFAVNTTQSASLPHGGGASMPLIDDAKFPNIGDRMTAGGVSWNWYSGGWDEAVAGHPGGNFQYHHQPLNYFANYADGGPGRSHLQDEKNFFTAARRGTLPQVSFVKPYGTENEHPGYASAHTGSDHLVDLVKAITNGPDGKDTLIVVTYDEFGGQADHVSVPKVDAWGPGTRIPALLISPRLSRSGVSHTQFDTTSILSTIEHSYGLAPLSSRDASVNDLSSAIKHGRPNSSWHSRD